MAAKKKTKKKVSRSNRTAARKTKLAKKSPKKKVSSKKKSPKKAPRRITVKKTALKKTSTKLKPIVSKAVVRKPKASNKRRLRDDDQLIEAPPIPKQRSTGDSSGQSGDLQGLSNSERADSESVDELLEEGNAFEAGIVSGVEDADNADEKEVRTHEVQEDDVPEEYLDEN
jgi:hypothetical protein